MNGNSDFVIENGVLQEYHGPGGDVTIPECVTEIGERAFEGCAALTEVVLPQTVRRIGPWAFYQCVHLTRIVCHEKSRSFRTEGPLVLSKRGAAVKCCAPGMAGVCEIPEGVHKIDAYAFAGCFQLTGLRLPEGVRSLEEEALAACTGLKELTLPESVAFLGPNVFADCGLPRLNILNGNIFLDGSVFGPQGAGVRRLVAERLSFKSLPASVKPAAVCGFTERREEAPDSYDPAEQAAYEAYMKNQRRRLFRPALEHLPLLRYFMEKQLISKDELPKLLEEAVRENMVEASALLLEYQNRTFGAETPETVLKREMRALETGSLPVGELRKIWSYHKRGDGTWMITSYKGWDQIVQVPAKIGRSVVTAIGENAFGTAWETESRLYEEYRRTRENLVQVELPETIQAIHSQAFDGCLSLERLIVPSSVTEIGKWAFDDCPKLTIYTPAGSYAEQYAEENHIPFVAE